MAANDKPIFPLVPRVSWAAITAANTATDGTGTVATVFTAGAEGARVDAIVCKSLGTNVATVLRLFLNNGSTNATPANNTLIAEVPLPATNGSNANVISAELAVQINRSIDAGFRVYAVLGTAVAAGWQLTAFGGDY